jgi:hypothetical protein
MVRPKLHDYGALFSVVSLHTEPVGCEEFTKEVFYGQGGLRSRTCDRKVQASTFGNGGGTL